MPLLAGHSHLHALIQLTLSMHSLYTLHPLLTMRIVKGEWNNADNYMASRKWNSFTSSFS